MLKSDSPIGESYLTKSQWLAMIACVITWVGSGYGFDEIQQHHKDLIAIFIFAGFNWILRKLDKIRLKKYLRVLDSYHQAEIHKVYKEGAESVGEKVTRV